jgi:predicted  nucleic acid-binding Zn-ribbon protein
MKRLSLILRIVAILAAAAAAFLFFTSKGKLAEKQTALETSKAATKATKSELATANGQISTLKKKLSTESKALATTKTKLESTREEMYTAQQQVSSTKQQVELSQNTIQDLQAATSELREKLIQAQKSQDLVAANRESEFAEMNERIRELGEANEALKLELAAAEAVKNSKKQTKGAFGRGLADSGEQTGAFSSKESSTSAGTSTTIASISRKDGIILLNTTAELGLTTGPLIILSRDSKALAKIEIVEVSEKFALANILPGTSAHGFSAGTTVKLLN